MLAAALGTAPPALAQRSGSTTRSSCGDAPPVGTVAKDIVNDFGRLA